MKKYAILVTFEPDISKVISFVNRAINQGYNVVIVDNSEINLLDKYMIDDKCDLITLNSNMGIAYAQNIGVKHAELNDADMISFFDQDSEIPSDFSKKMEEALMLKNMICVVCPLSIDKSSKQEYPAHKFNKPGIAKCVYSKNENELVQVDIAISSGTTTTLNAFKEIGYFDEDFFIDFVDIEWCIRARKNGIPIFIVPDVEMYHSIGDNTIKTLFFEVSSHSPIRTYYKVRNAFLLLRKNVRVLFALQQLLPAIIHNFILIFYKKNKKEYFKFYLKGLWQGIIGKTGKYQE